MNDKSNTKCERTGVIICGGGPTGALLSAMLGRMEIPNVVLEREREITTDPRGIALDEEGIRLIQSIGMYDRIHTSIGQCWYSPSITLNFQETNPGIRSRIEMYQRPAVKSDETSIPQL